MVMTTMLRLTALFCRIVCILVMMDGVTSFSVSEKVPAGEASVPKVPAGEDSALVAPLKTLDPPLVSSRRVWLGTAAAALTVVTGASVWGANPTLRAAWTAHAVDKPVAISESISSISSAEEDVYFGVGCFWHIQHEFVQAERTLLGRTDDTITALAGYAGGTKADHSAGIPNPLGRVCYHNLLGVADYGKLGHGEVVGMRLPQNRIVDFARFYFGLFSKSLTRVDPGDKGGEYRSLLGLAGGVKHPVYSEVKAAADAAGFTLQAAVGNDSDTFATPGLVLVYDTEQFPFYQAEVYHQFHNDFQSPPYGATYNGLADTLFAQGRIQPTGCPDRV
jgi:peptide methionine sulfoxide reductase MsrA